MALIFVAVDAIVPLVITPSLAYMAEATSSAGVGSFGVGYGLYNMAWGVGLLGGPALGGFLFERVGLRAADAGRGRRCCCSSRAAAGTEYRSRIEPHRPWRSIA